MWGLLKIRELSSFLFFLHFAGGNCYSNEFLQGRVKNKR